jgi:hypothetical protein
MLHERSASEYRKPVLYAIIDALQRRRQKEKHAWAICVHTTLHSIFDTACRYVAGS